MTQDFALHVLRDMLLTTALVAAPVLLAVLLAGLAVSVLQVATQVQEMTLTFVPKLIVTVVVLVVSGGWMVTTLKNMAIELIRRSAAF